LYYINFGWILEDETMLTTQGLRRLHKDDSAFSVQEKHSRLLLELAMRLCPGSETFDKEVLEALDELFGFDKTMFMYTNKSGFFEDCCSHNLSVDDFGIYKKAYASDDPFAPANNRSNQRVYSIRDIMSYEEYEKSKVFKIITRCRVYYQASAFLNYNGETVAAISFFRGKEKGEFSKEEMNLMNEITIVIENQLLQHMNMLQYRRVSVERRALVEVLGKLNCGLILCDSHFSVLSVSDNLESIMPESFHRAAWDAYESLIRNQLLPVYYQENSEYFMIPSLPGLSFSMYPIVDMFANPRYYDTIYAITVFPANAARERIFKSWKHKLTKRETQICGFIAQDMDVKAVAGYLGISEHTCKRHLENIYRKLGISRRRDLLNILSSE
jgi:DNA-binding CsgD family transcriptional regulator